MNAFSRKDVVYIYMKSTRVAGGNLGIVRPSLMSEAKNEVAKKNNKNVARKARGKFWTYSHF